MKPRSLLASLACRVLRKRFQMLDAEECREHAMQCMKQAAEAIDPLVKQRLIEAAQGWRRLATDLATLEEKLAQEKQTAA